MKRLLVVIILASFFLSLIMVVRADLNSDIDQLGKDIESLKNELNKKQVNYQKLRTQLENIKAKIVILENAIVQKEKEVVQGEQVLDYQKKLLNERAKSYYKNINKSAVSLLDLLVGGNLSQTLDNFFYQKTIVDEDRKTIIKIVLYIKNLEEKKKALEQEKIQLAALKVEVDKQTEILSGDISQTQQKIAELTTKQQELIAAKLASIPLPRSAETSLSGCRSDIDIDPGFGTRLAFFSFGVPNKIGLNQYGAKGRADSGQDMETILRAYYNYDSLSDVDTNIKIRVDGHSEYSLEDYVKRIYEMPADWNMEALKAQAIAARSYVLAYTNNGAGSICDSENCQVFKDSEKGGRWNEAVEATKGKAMIQGGSPVKAWFSSTHGGVVLTSSEVGWSETSWTKHAIDTPSGSSGSSADLQSNAYDRSSPWFYCDWGYRSQHNNTAWLKQEEVTDIVNAFILYAHDRNTLVHLSQTDKDVPDTWSPERVREELKKYETPIGSAEIDVSWDSSGISRTIMINGKSFNAQEFKNFFNMRAPANIQIKPACKPNDVDLSNDCPYALYNIEKR